MINLLPTIVVPFVGTLLFLVVLVAATWREPTPRPAPVHANRRRRPPTIDGAQTGH